MEKRNFPEFGKALEERKIRCPKCGAIVIENAFKELFCPNCGIIAGHTTSTIKRPGYIR